MDVYDHKVYPIVGGKTAQIQVNVSKKKTSMDLGMGSHGQTLQLVKTQRETTSLSPTRRSFNYVVETAIDNSVSMMGGENQNIEFGSMNCIYDTGDPILTSAHLR